MILSPADCRWAGPIPGVYDAWRFGQRYKDFVSDSQKPLPQDFERALRWDGRFEGEPPKGTAIRKPNFNENFDEIFGLWNAAEAEEFDVWLRCARRLALSSPSACAPCGRLQ